MSNRPASSPPRPASRSSTSSPSTSSPSRRPTVVEVESIRNPSTVAENPNTTAPDRGCGVSPGGGCWRLVGDGGR